jgi:hypothetical protein
MACSRLWPCVAPTRGGCSPGAKTDAGEAARAESGVAARGRAGDEPPRGYRSCAQRQLRRQRASSSVPPSPSGGGSCILNYIIAANALRFGTSSAARRSALGRTGVIREAPFRVSTDGGLLWPPLRPWRARPDQRARCGRRLRQITRCVSARTGGARNYRQADPCQGARTVRLIGWASRASVPAPMRSVHSAPW